MPIKIKTRYCLFPFVTVFLSHIRFEIDHRANYFSIDEIIAYVNGILAVLIWFCLRSTIALYETVARVNGRFPNTCFGIDKYIRIASL